MSERKEPVCRRTEQGGSVRIGPHPFWRWAVAPSSGNGVPGIGFMTKRAALRCKAEIQSALPAPYFLPPVLLKRTGPKSCEEWPA